MTTTPAPDSTELSAQHKILQDINQALLDRAEITDTLYQANQNILEDIKKAKEEYENLNNNLADRKKASKDLADLHEGLADTLKRQGKMTERFLVGISKGAESVSKKARGFKLLASGLKDATKAFL